MTDAERIAELEQQNANLRKAIDNLEEERDHSYAYYMASKDRLKALAGYLGLVSDALRETPFLVWKRNAIRDAVEYLESGSKSRVVPLWEEHPNDTFREAWAILQYWDSELDEDPEGLKALKIKYSPKKP